MWIDSLITSFCIFSPSFLWFGLDFQNFQSNFYHYFRSPSLFTFCRFISKQEIEWGTLSCIYLIIFKNVLFCINAPENDAKRHIFIKSMRANHNSEWNDVISNWIVIGFPLKVMLFWFSNFGPNPHKTWTSVGTFINAKSSPFGGNSHQKRNFHIIITNPFCTMTSKSLCVLPKFVECIKI